jgi:hypothetical protein
VDAILDGIPRSRRAAARAMPNCSAHRGTAGQVDGHLRLCPGEADRTQLLPPNISALRLAGRVRRSSRTTWRADQVGVGASSAWIAPGKRTDVWRIPLGVPVFGLVRAAVGRSAALSSLGPTTPLPSRLPIPTSGYRAGIGYWHGVRGSLRRKGPSWELRVYLGRDPISGRKRYATRNVRGPRRQAERVLREMVTAAEAGATHRGGCDLRGVVRGLAGPCA